MKLIFCKRCADMVMLVKRSWRTCQCSQSSGRYEDDGLTATLRGPCLPVGINNGSLIGAALRQPESGDGKVFWVGLTTFAYFFAVVPLPPGRSKIRQFIDSLMPRQLAAVKGEA